MRLWLLLISVAISTQLCGQWEWSSRLGFVIAHRPVINGLNQAHAKTYNLSWQKKLVSEESWIQSYLGPTFMVQGGYTQFGSDVFGSAFHVTPSLALPLWRAKAPVSLILGTGLAWHPSFFNAVDNRKQVAIGSPINASIQLGLQVALLSFRRHQLRAGLFFHHFSNGAFSAPNLGLNVPSISLSYAFLHPSNTDQNLPTSKRDKAAYRAQWFAAGSLGLKELMITGEKKYLLSTVRLGRSRTWSAKFAGVVFAEYMNHPAQRVLAQLDTLASGSGQHQVGMGVGISNTYGRFAVFIHTAYYLINPYRNNGSMYNRLGIQYQVSKGFHIFTGIRSHLTTADGLEWGGTIYF
ncbi:MAG TPA: acyloxyacyl hydrolase [Luteibaculaceae bacterium]|nr:acyloxyacyl hydrolase [Luteibaculaceae bacterium]